MFIGPVSRISERMMAAFGAMRVLPHPRKPGPANLNPNVNILNDEFRSSQREKEVSL